MRIPALCLATLAVTAQADKFNWAGKWVAQSAMADACAPAGVLTVTQEGDKTTVKGKWDPFNKVCKEYELAGEAIDKNDGALADNTLTLDMKSKNGTDFKVVFANMKDKDNKDVQSLQSGTTNPLKLETFTVNKKSDDDLKKFKNVVGSYSFKITEGDDKICCIPEKFEVSEQETALLYTTGKWANSEACKNQKLGEVAFEKVGVSVPKENSIQWSTGATGMMAFAGIGPADDKKPDELSFVSGTNDQKCKITATRSSSKWWIWLIVAIVVALVVAGAGFFFYKKRQASNKHTPLMTA
jgi:hypothetical protein